MNAARRGTDVERIVIDETVHEKPLARRSSAELADKAVHLIAVVHPRFDPARYEMFGPEISGGELVRRANSNGPWIPGDGIIPRLRELG